MRTPIAFANGSWLPQTELAVPVWDAGFVLGTTVTEQLRTFRGQIFALDAHLERLERSTQLAGIESPISHGALASVAHEIVERNYSLLPLDGDLGLAILITPGVYEAFAPPEANRLANVYVHTYPLRFELWARAYRQGQELALAHVRQVPGECWSPALKCRSRMHYFLADQEVARRYPGARAVLADQQGNVTETAIANLIVSLDGTALVTPPANYVLPGITLAVVRGLAEKLGMDWEERSIAVGEMDRACEILLTSTASGIVPGTRWNGKPVGTGTPGALYARLLDAFRDLVGIDFVAQAEHFANLTGAAT